jgi:ABC-type amino acid transport substrate-binding protein
MRYKILRTGLTTISLLFSAASADAADRAKPPEDPQEKPLQAAMMLMVQGRSADASVAVDPILAAYDAQYASEKRKSIVPKHLTKRLGQC